MLKTYGFAFKIKDVQNLFNQRIDKFTTEHTQLDDDALITNLRQNVINDMNLVETDPDFITIEGVRQVLMNMDNIKYSLNPIALDLQKYLLNQFNANSPFKIKAAMLV